MQKIRKILVPIDFSQEAGGALRDAAVLGRETGAQVVALHVIDEKAERNVLLSAIAPVDGLPFFFGQLRNGAAGHSAT
ncbi:MAG TPA: universal stress protein [Candidatus Limnocylindrales bacterium]|nr:universal stress protein [Candidatus Limnocylindrales bacterium]